MSVKHNTKHNRSRSHYKERLQARGLQRSPMTPYNPEILAAIHAREDRTGTRRVGH